MAKKSVHFFLLIAILLTEQLHLSSVFCQEDETTTRCLPRKIFDAFLRLPEVSSNLAAYSRTARIIQDDRNDFVQFKSLSTHGSDQDDMQICLPSLIYYEIFSDPSMRSYLNAVERAQKMMENTDQSNESVVDQEKRSIATLAKNGDLPASIQEREQGRREEGEKRSRTSITPEEVLKEYLGEASDNIDSQTAAQILAKYTLPSGELDIQALRRDFGTTKRNIATLARDYALPSNRRTLATMSRDFTYPYLKRNIGSLARSSLLPAGKRSQYTMSRFYVIPWLEAKRNIGSLARDSAIPRYGKRGIANLAKNGDFPMPKKNVGTLARDWSLPQTRSERSISNNPFVAELNDIKNRSRDKRQVDYSDEYPLPVMQNTNVLDYEDVIEALANGFPSTAKRFMETGGLQNKWQDIDDERVRLSHEVPYQPSKRHIGALARQGWLPSFRAARFSRSPRYLVGRSDQ